MSAYAILVYPAANRVYADVSPRLLRAELAIFGKSLNTSITEIADETFGGVPYVVFHTATALTKSDISLLSNLSTLYALFEVNGDSLTPIDVAPMAIYDSDLLTIQKYTGKTNELFTKLLLNLALLSADSPQSMLSKHLRVLDPLCGRGTTLNQAMMYGYDAVGIDIDRKDFEAYGQFIKTWLRDKRIKHQAQSGQFRRNKEKLGQRLEIEFAASKERYKSGNVQQIRYFNCDTGLAADILKQNSIDVVVTDLPYGVHHGSHDNTQLTRKPDELLKTSLPGWVRALRPGGSVAISWNINVISRHKLVDILVHSGLDVCEDADYTHFEHRVDHAIVRDLVIATKPLVAK